MAARSSTSKRPDTRRDYRPAAARRGEIIAAAQAEFIRANFAGARTRDIAAAAGVNQATLFKHFPTKEYLFEAAVSQFQLYTASFARRKSGSTAREE